MELIYHGSQLKNLKELQTHKSTHGNYVYATKDKNIALLFSNHIFNDNLVTISKNSETGAYEIIERVPGILEEAFNKDSTIYTLSSETFKDINTGFDEVVSDKNVPIMKEEHIENIYSEIKKLEQKGVFKLYQYPNRPKSIPNNDSDLLQRELNQINRTGKQINQESFDKLLLFHPNLLPMINQYIIENNIAIEPIKKEDILNTYSKYISYQMIAPNERFNLGISTRMIANTYPEFIPTLQNMSKILDANKETKINFMLNTLSNNLDEQSKFELASQSNKYLTDERNIPEIGIEIIKECKNLKNKQKENNKEQQLSNTRKKVLIKDGFTSINILIIMIILITIILTIIFIK